MDAALKPKIGIIAGGGAAPFQVARACREQGRPYFLFCLEGQADGALSAEGPHIWMALGAAGKLRDACESEGIREIVMIGRVRRPSLMELKPDFLGVKVLARIGLHALGDDGVLRAVSEVVEETCGVRFVGAHEVMESLLTPEGVLTKIAPDERSQADIAKGFEIAEALGRLDVGQAVVVQQGIVLGLEAVEGTDALIARAGEHKRRGDGGVLIKSSKPQQDERFDLPTIGPGTIEGLVRAGLAGVALEAGHSLLVERAQTLAAADAAGLFIVGVTRSRS